MLHRSRTSSLSLMLVISSVLILGPVGCSSMSPRTKWWQFWRPKAAPVSEIYNGSTAMLPPPPDILDAPLDPSSDFGLVDNLGGSGVGLEPIAMEDLEPFMGLPPVEPIRTAAAGMIADLVTVHFAFDESVLDEAAKQALDQNLAWIQANPGAQIQIEGHCDERGTVEYNLLLGDTRAQAVKAYLVSRGIEAGNLHTISYGEERPLDAAADAVAFAKNRRAQFLVY